MQRIAFLIDSQRVDGTLALPRGVKQKVPAVLFFHGMTSSEKSYIPYAKALAEKGIAGFALSMRGHGTSEGDFHNLSVLDCVNDALAAYDILLTIPAIDKERVGVCGASLGAAVASILSGQRAVKSLVLRAPAIYTDQIMQMTFPQILAEEEGIFRGIHDGANTPSLKAISEFLGSLLVVTSENDTLIPKNIPELYLSEAKKAQRKDRAQIKEATHTLSKEAWRQKFQELIINWFAQTL